MWVQNQKLLQWQHRALVGPTATVRARAMTQQQPVSKAPGLQVLIKWNMEYFEVLLGYDWEQVTSAAGHVQWTPKAGQGAPEAPMAHDASKTQPLMMTTADMALKLDPEFAEISQHFLDNPEEFADAYARAWYKLTHRDMGPLVRYLGEEVPSEELIWQDPVPAGNSVSDADVAKLKEAILASGLSVSQLVNTAWASASTFRGSDLRGGANGGRITLAPQKDWDINTSSGVADVIAKLDEVRGASGVDISHLQTRSYLVVTPPLKKLQAHAVPFTSGRGDTTQELTDVESFEVLEPKFDGFRNYKNTRDPRATEELLGRQGATAYPYNV